MQDTAVTANSKPFGIVVLVLAILVFGLGQLAGRAVSAHPPKMPAPDAAPAGDGDPATRVLDLSALTDMDNLIGRLAERQVVFVGESHDRYEHHLNQLAIIQGLHARHPDLAIGMEFFQQPYQPHLDRYVAGEIDEKELLRATEYFDRWRFDYRLYRPILRLARDKGIPLIALNVPRELTEKVGNLGFEGLSPEDRAQVPAGVERDDPAYRARIEAVFRQHPGSQQRNFENFLDAQLLWDEGMAERATAWLREHPEGHLVILAGNGHVEYGQGIPRRLLRRVPASAVIVMNAAQHSPEPGLADYLLYPRPVELPRSGLMGVLLDSGDQGVTVKGFSDDSPAQLAGMKEGDRILSIGGEPVGGYTDVRVALLDHNPGDEVPVDVHRKVLFMGDERLSLTIKLH